MSRQRPPKDTQNFSTAHYLHHHSPEQSHHQFCNSHLTGFPAPTLASSQPTVDSDLNGPAEISKDCGQILQLQISLTSGRKQMAHSKWVIRGEFLSRHRGWQHRGPSPLLDLKNEEEEWRRRQSAAWRRQLGIDLKPRDSPTQTIL